LVLAIFFSKKLLFSYSIIHLPNSLPPPALNITLVLYADLSDLIGYYNNIFLIYSLINYFN